MTEQVSRLEKRIEAKCADWLGLLTRKVESGRAVLRALLVEPIRFTPIEDVWRRGDAFTATLALDHIVSGIVDLTREGGTVAERGTVVTACSPLDPINENGREHAVRFRPQPGAYPSGHAKCLGKYVLQAQEGRRSDLRSVAVPPSFERPSCSSARQPLFDPGESSQVPR